MSLVKMTCVCTQVELPEICHSKNDEQNFMALAHMDMPGQEGSDVRIKNPIHGFTPSMQSEQRQSCAGEPLEAQGWKLGLRMP